GNGRPSDDEPSWSSSTPFRLGALAGRTARGVGCPGPAPRAPAAMVTATAAVRNLPRASPRPSTASATTRQVAFHLLHGDSDDAPASHQFAQRFGLGAGYLPLMDMFFNQTGLPELYSTAALPHRVSDVLREAMWLSRWPHPRPAVPGRCNETVPMRY
ncbi:unnamed protein product, partial [Prorocentrum cordatum]